MYLIVTTGFRCLILFSRLEESRLKITVTNTIEYILEYVVRLQIYGRTLSLESSFYHIFIQVQKSEWEPYIDPRVITPPIYYGVPYRYGDACTRIVILCVVTLVHVYCISDDTYCTYTFKHFVIK